MLNRLVGRNEDADGAGPGGTAGRHYVSDALDRILEIDRADGVTIKHRYLFGPAVDQILADEAPPSNTQTGPVLWPLADHLGTVKDLAQYDPGTNTTTVVNHRVLDSFGKVLSETNAAVDHAFTFTGGPEDDWTHLVNRLNRWDDPATQRWINPDPSGLRPDTNPYRYVENSPTVYVDPFGLAHLPSDSRGKWIEGVRGDGVFEYSDTAQNCEAGLAGKRIRFKSQCIALGGFPAEAYYGGSAESARVEIETVTGTSADNTAADAAMREKLQDPKWRRPAAYTWNHAGEPGSKAMELVDHRFHKAVAHEGPAAGPRAASRAARIQGGMGHAIAIANVYTALRDACQAAGVVPPDYGVVEAPYYFVADDSSVFIVEEPGWVLSWFANPKRKYIAGPREGQSEDISSEQVEAHRKEAEAEWGRYIPGNLFREPRFTPGRQRTTLPMFDPSGSVKTGWVDEEGVHQTRDGLMGREGA